MPAAQYGIIPLAHAKNKTDTITDGDGFPHLPRGATWFRLPGVFTTGGALGDPDQDRTFFSESWLA